MNHQAVAMTVELASAETVAQRFGVKVDTVRRWVRDRRIPYIRASRRIVRFDLRAVENALTRGASTANLQDESHE